MSNKQNDVWYEQQEELRRDEDFEKFASQSAKYDRRIKEVVRWADLKRGDKYATKS